MPDDTQPDLTERARALAQQLAVRFTEWIVRESNVDFWSENNAEDRLAEMSQSFIAAALQSEREAEREKVATLMLRNSIATGHGDTTDDLLTELQGHLSEREAAAAAAFQSERAQRALAYNQLFDDYQKVAREKETAAAEARRAAIEECASAARGPINRRGDPYCDGRIDAEEAVHALASPAPKQEDFPEKTTETIKCPATGEQIPAVLVATWCPTMGYVYCPVCSARRRERIWHKIGLFPTPQE